MHSTIIIRNNLFTFFFFYFFFQLVSSSRYLSSSTAFLFSLVNKPGWGPVTFRPPGNDGFDSYQHATYDKINYGPTFGGGHDIYIASYASSKANSATNLGWSYNPPAGHSYNSLFTKSFLASSHRFQPDEIEVFYETIWGERNGEQSVN